MYQKNKFSKHFRAIDLIEFDNRFEPAMNHIFGNVLVCSDLDVANKVRSTIFNVSPFVSPVFEFSKLAGGLIACDSFTSQHTVFPHIRPAGTIFLQSLQLRVLIEGWYYYQNFKISKVFILKSATRKSLLSKSCVFCMAS